MAINIKTHEVPLSEVRKRLTDIINDVKYNRETYVFTRNNRPNTVLISSEDFDLFKKLLEIHYDYAPVKEREEQLSLLLSNRDRDKVLADLTNPPKMDSRMRSAIKAAKERFKTDEQ